MSIYMLKISIYACCLRANWNSSRGIFFFLSAACLCRLCRGSKKEKIRRKTTTNERNNETMEKKAKRKRDFTLFFSFFRVFYIAFTSSVTHTLPSTFHYFLSFISREKDFFWCLLRRWRKDELCIIIAENFQCLVTGTFKCWKIVYQKYLWKL